jgi:hypothetical protein
MPLEGTLDSEFVGTVSKTCGTEIKRVFHSKKTFKKTSGDVNTPLLVEI